MFVVLLLILAIVGIGAFVVFENERATQLITAGASFFETKTSCNKVGDCIDLFIPAQPDFNIAESQPDFEEQTFYDNGTEKPLVPTSYVTGAVADTSYSKTGTKESKYREIDNKMIVTIGNVATIEGQIKLIDAEGNIVEPRIYKFWLTIDCSDQMEFCNMTTRSYRDVTNNGSFIYKWTTNFNDRAGLYVVEIYVESEQLDIYDRPYSVKNQIFIELV